MKRFYLAIVMMFVGVSALWSQHTNVVWDTSSWNSPESMPYGGGDIGMNIWVKEGDILPYLSRSGTFDENNRQLEQGRSRLRLSPNPFEDTRGFRQELKLIDGYVEISAEGTQVQLQADVFHPIVHIEVINDRPLQAEIFHENWRHQDRLIRKGEGQQCSYKWAPPKGTTTHADLISLENSSEKDSRRLLLYHRNAEETVFDVTAAQQGMNEVRLQMMSPPKNPTFGGYLSGENLEYIGTLGSVYAGTDYHAWGFRSLKAFEKHHFSAVLHVEQTETVIQWE